jgi:hypothetical protein
MMGICIFPLLCTVVLSVSSVSSDRIVKGIIVNTAVKTAKVDEQKTNIYNILLINMLIFNEQRVPKITFVLVLTYDLKLHLFVILTAIG